jgi:hypothetical protein
MSNASVISSTVLTMLCVGWALGDDGDKSEKPSGYVSMILSSASFAPEGSRSQMRCKVTLVNDTGKDLIVDSYFHGPSVYDSMELVITGKNGIVQRQQLYGYHKDPTFSNTPKNVTLARGATESLISFPLFDAESLPRIVKVRLVGTLPGSGYFRICSSETVEVVVNDRANDPGIQHRSTPLAPGGEGEKKAEKPSGYVSVVLSSASLAPDGSDFQMLCKVTLVNDTGKELSEPSYFRGQSVYDSMELVITDKNGILQRQVRYTNHKDTTSSNKAKEVRLARGATESLISFPLRDAESLPSMVKVRLVGTIWGSGYSRICSSETVEVIIRGATR